MKRLALLVALALSLRCPLRDSSGDRPIPGVTSHPARQGSAMTNQLAPYYETPDKSIRIFHARWEDVRDAGIFKPKDIALVHADPPYGNGFLAMNNSVKSSKARRWNPDKCDGFTWNPIVGDDKPFDPAELLALKRPTVLWGANHYSHQVPGSSGWLIWDKRKDQPSNNNADIEIAWSNLGGPARQFTHEWNGFTRASEVGLHVHPTQKPEALSAWVFNHAMARKKLKRGDTILIPYMGSGPDLRPAQAMGLKVIACEVDESYCRTAVNARLHAVAPNQSDVNLGPLFEART